MKLFFAATFLILNLSSAFSMHSNNNSLKGHDQDDSNQNKKRLKLAVKTLSSRKGKIYYIKVNEAFQKIDPSKFKSIILGVSNIEQEQKLSAYDLHYVIKSLGNIDSERHNSIIQHMKDLAGKQDWNTDCPAVDPHMHLIPYMDLAPFRCPVDNCHWDDAPVGAVIDALALADQSKLDVIKHYTKKFLMGRMWVECYAQK
ncbi:MAG: hypothetical protein Q8L85_00680 [Alphaproteobacteria bacterium]|nr:hypothetical protein [Alphaproteobacteria bacterium]